MSNKKYEGSLLVALDCMKLATTKSELILCLLNIIRNMYIYIRHVVELSGLISLTLSDLKQTNHFFIIVIFL